jgi:DtxR family Mn-dependent transcriptional regulator
VHDIAEQLEHVQSDMLVDKLNKYLRFPKYDPHGDPIPNAEGRFTLREQLLLSRATVETKVILVGVKNNQKDFLKHLNKLNIYLGCEIHILSKEEYDASLSVSIDQSGPITLSNQIASNLFIKNS